MTIDGTATEGQTLTASDNNSIADEDGLGTFTYQWKRGDTNIDGANQARYTLTQADVDQRITVEVSYVDGHGQDEKLKSSPTAKVTNENDLPTGSTKISAASRALTSAVLVGKILF